MPDPDKAFLEEWRKQICAQNDAPISLGDIPIEINGKPFIAKDVKFLGVEIGPIETADLDNIETFELEVDLDED